MITYIKNLDDKPMIWLVLIQNRTMKII